MLRLVEQVELQGKAKVPREEEEVVLVEGERVRELGSVRQGFQRSDSTPSPPTRHYETETGQKLTLGSRV